MRLAVLASGSGTILEAMLADGLAIELVVVDRACRATDIAASAGVAVRAIDRDNFGPSFDRDRFTEKVVAALLEADVELVVMAGYGTILGQSLYDHFGERVVNTHPALLPSFKGWHAVRAALDAGVKVTGCTVHVATVEVDDGPILAQEAVPVQVGDTEETLHERIKVVERSLYLQTVREIIERGSVL
ncbi:MAG: phosphoribosylglycinamide formyltransferase [Acidimicrobiales bacterium]